MIKRSIKVGKQGYHTKSHSLFNGEGVKLVIREYIFSSRDKLLVVKLAKALGNYLSP